MTVQADGFRPGSAARVVMLSEPTELATATASSAGVVRAVVRIPAGVALGRHTIEVRGTAPDGSPVVRSAAFIVTVSGPMSASVAGSQPEPASVGAAGAAPGAASVGGDELPRTGWGAVWLVFWAILLVAFGRGAIAFGNHEMPARPRL